MEKKPAEARDHLTGEHHISDIGQAIIYVLFMATWITDTIFHYSTFLSKHISPFIQIPLAIVFFLLSGYLAFKGLSLVFGKKRQKSGVIRTGVFSFVRHPIYLSEILLYLGFLLLNTSLAAIVIWIIGIGFLHYISRYEEKLLLARYGEEYKRYMAEIPMWIPRFWRRIQGIAS
jgi:protein-S-isoprenylcysteine O-methyltransferase Ste14